MKIISIKIVLPSKSKTFVVFAEEIQRLEIAYKSNHFEWRKTREKNKREKQESKTRIKNKNQKQK